MRYFVAVTDKAWYSYLASKEPDEVNFWRPTASGSFRAISEGSPFLFKLHSPDNFIVGGGFFVKYDRLPLSLAWKSFGEKNGAPDLSALLASVSRYRSQYRRDRVLDPQIGCIILAEPFFFNPEQWIPVPRDWSSNIPGKTYDTQTEVGSALWSRVSNLLLAQTPTLGEDLLQDAAMVKEAAFGSLYLARARLGQGAFRVLVTGAYERRCAISGQKVLPVLEAAHIKPHSESGPNLVTNGLLLRSDMHILFDQGYLTVTPDLHIEVSAAIQEEFHNGRDYYAYRGRPLAQVPRRANDRPARQFLEWHNEVKFMS